MSLVCSWNEVGMSHVQVSSSPFCTRPFWQMPNFLNVHAHSNRLRTRVASYLNLSAETTLSTMHKPLRAKEFPGHVNCRIWHVSLRPRDSCKWRLGSANVSEGLSLKMAVRMVERSFGLNGPTGVFFRSLSRIGYFGAFLPPKQNFVTECCLSICLERPKCPSPEAPEVCPEASPEICRNARNFVGKFVFTPPQSQF